MRPAVIATAACAGCAPVAKALGCGLGVMYRRGLGSLARAARSSTTAWYSGNSWRSTSRARAEAIASLSENQ